MASPWHSTATRTVLPVPLGSATVARSCWSLYLGSMFKRMCASADSVNFAVALSIMNLMPVAGSCGAMRPGTEACALRKRLDCFASFEDLPSLRVARCFVCRVTYEGGGWVSRGKARVDFILSTLFEVRGLWFAGDFRETRDESAGHAPPGGTTPSLRPRRRTRAPRSRGRPRKHPGSVCRLRSWGEKYGYG